MTYHYGPPPWPPLRRHQSWLPWIVVALLATFITVCGVIIMATSIGHPGPAHFTQSETKFLGSVKGSSPLPELSTGRPWEPWPDDAELVSEGHQVCSTLAITGGDRERVVENPIIGKPVMPAFMERYPVDQRDELVGAAVRHLCTEYATWFGGIPI